MCLNPFRTAVAALRPRFDRAVRPDLLPADCTRRADAKPLGCLAARYALGSGLDDPTAKISGKLHAGLIHQHAARIRLDEPRESPIIQSARKVLQIANSA